MTIELTAPPAEMMKQFGALDATIGADAGGHDTRRFAKWFAEAEMQAREQSLRSTDFEQRRRAIVVADALGASRRVVIAAWAKKHGGELAP